VQNIVYVLGAGFSAPLGLPVMANFWIKSKEIARTEPEKYGHITAVIEKLKQTNSTGSYFEYPQFNVEEALSILEIAGNLGSDVNLDTFRKYIIAVITYLTPEINAVDLSALPSDWRDKIFGNEERWQWYGHFVASLHHIQITFSKYEDPYRRIRYQFHARKRNTGISYDVMSLNYDMVLEQICNYINGSFPPLMGSNFHFAESTEDAQKLQRPILAKIHGSVSDGRIIPPTYLKGLYQSSVPTSWKVAYEILRKAHQIRIVGYSLPATDAYVRYLLKAAVGGTQELEKVDVICRDSNGIVEERYKDFIRFKGLSFRRAMVEDYLGKIYQLRTVDIGGEEYVFDKLERAHEDFMGHHT